MSFQLCAACGTPLPSDAPEGFCPHCSFGGALQAGRAEGAAVPGPPEDFPINEPFPARSAFATGAVFFGDYEVLEEIAHGGMGVVYKARQRSLDRIVAIKMLLFGPQAKPEHIKRFRAEAIAAASLQHTNIVAIHEVGVQDEGRHYFVMDFVEGQSLAEIVGQTPLPAQRAARYVKRIAEAIHYAHERGVLHRDLKPSNVLIDAQDQPRVTDFGLAKRFDGESELTLSGQVVGSPGYLPPEQAEAKRGKVSRHSDVYGLGAILYQLVTARPPFQAETLPDVLRQVVSTEPVAPRLLNPSLPRDLETICLKCLEKEPARRYRTAQMVAEELGRFLAGEPVQARPLGPVGKTWRWCRRKPVVAGLAAGLAAALLLGMTGVVWEWRRAEAEALSARLNAYAADMKEVQRALEANDLGRARDLLRRYRPDAKSEIRSPKSEVERAARAGSSRASTLNPQPLTDLRGWEWRYFWSRCQGDERFTLYRYSNSVSALAFSPDGKWLAVSCGDETIALWDAVAKRPRARFPARGWRWDKALAFSPTGDVLAWGSAEAGGREVVRLRDLRAQKDLPPLLHSNRVVSLAFSPDAKAIATLDFAGTVRIWSFESQEVLTQFPTKGLASLDRSLENTPVAASLAGRPMGGRRQSKPGQGQAGFGQSAVFADHYSCLVFSPNGRWLAVGEASPQIRLVDRIIGTQRIIPMSLPADGISALAYSPDSQLLAVACGAGDDAVHLWDVSAEAEVRLTGHSGWITGLVFSPDGQTLASVSTDQTLRLWDVRQKVELRRFQGNTDEVWAVAWSPDGKELATGARDGSVRFWDPATEPVAPYTVLPEPIRFWGPTFSPDSRTLLAATRTDGEVVRFDTKSAQVVERLSFLGNHQRCLALSTDGRWLALGDASGDVRVWDFNAQQWVANMSFPGAGLFALWFSPRGRFLIGGAAVPGGPWLGKLWEVNGWREVDAEGIDTRGFFEADFSADERTLAIGYRDGNVVWWDLATKQRRAVFPQAGQQLAFSGDGHFFATARGAEILLWDTTKRRSRPISQRELDYLHDMTFSPDSRRLVASGTSREGLIRLWDVATGRDVAILPGEPGWYSHIGFSPDGNTLFAASLEGTALLWHAPSLAQIDSATNRGSR